MNLEKMKTASDGCNIGSGDLKTSGTIYHAASSNNNTDDYNPQGKFSKFSRRGLLDDMPDDELKQLFNAVITVLPWEEIDNGAEELTELAAGRVLYAIIDGADFRLFQFVDDEGLLWIRKTAGGQVGYYRPVREKKSSDDCPGFLEWLKIENALDGKIQFLETSTFCDTGEYDGSLSAKLKALCYDLMDAGCPETEYTAGGVVEALDKAQPDGIKDYQLAVLAVAYSLYKAQNGIRGEGCVWRK